MRVELIAAISSDGYIAHNSDELVKWSSKEDKQFFSAETKRIGTMVMGRKTYDTLGRSLPDRKTIVLTRHPEDQQSQENVEFTSLSPIDLVERLTQEGVEGIAICGGSQIYTAFLAAGLVDLCLITVESVLLHDGIRLVSDELDGTFQHVYSEYLSDDTSVQALKYTQ